MHKEAAAQDKLLEAWGTFCEFITRRFEPFAYDAVKAGIGDGLLSVR